jgi:hypothetical protein
MGRKISSSKEINNITEHKKLKQITVSAAHLRDTA